MVVGGVCILLDCFFVDRDDSLNCCHTCFRGKPTTTQGTQIDEFLVPLRHDEHQGEEYCAPPSHNVEDYEARERYDIAEILGGSMRHKFTSSPA